MMDAQFGTMKLFSRSSAAGGKVSQCSRCVCSSRICYITPGLEAELGLLCNFTCAMWKMQIIHCTYIENSLLSEVVVLSPAVKLFNEKYLHTVFNEGEGLGLDEEF